MKNKKLQIGLLFILLIIVQSCKKNNQNVNLEHQEYYSIGTILSNTENIVIPTLKDSSIVDKNRLLSESVKETVIKKNSELAYLSPVNSAGYENINDPNKSKVFGLYLMGSVVARSDNGLYRAVFQADGNFVIYNSSNTVLWASGNKNYIPGSALTTLEFQSDGNVVHYMDIRNRQTSVTWSGRVLSGPNPIWVMQDDGNFVGYSDHVKNTNGTITIAGSAYAATGTGGGSRSRHSGRF